MAIWKIQWWGNEEILENTQGTKLLALFVNKRVDYTFNIEKSSCVVLITLLWSLGMLYYMISSRWIKCLSLRFNDFNF